MKRDDIYYQAMKTRDHRFDGKFFVGVKTTGIYCRPICPAQPKRENVEFFHSSLEAERKGYRPCLRCRPEAAPNSSAWMGTSAVVQRAMRVIRHLDAFESDEDQFAKRFGVTARHLRRLFVEEIGKTPKQLISENRLNLARKLIVETQLSLTEVSFAAGFGSVRRFNDAFKDRFKKSPSEIRRNTLSVSSGLKLGLSYRPPFDFEGLMQSYRSHRIGHLEWFDDHRMHRLFELNGEVGQVSIANDPENFRLLLEIDFPDISKVQSILSKVRTMFDLDSDPVLIANSLEVVPGLKAALKKHPGIRLPSGWDPFELAIATILGQLVSVDRARALVSDLIETLGRDSGVTVGGHRVKLFPTAAQIAASDLTDLKTTSARRRTLIAFSKAVVSGKIWLEPTQDVEVFIQNALEIPGIGPWTASYMALKCLRHTDAFPGTDLVLARAIERHSKESIDRSSPWRGYAAALLWRQHSSSKK